MSGTREAIVIGAGGHGSVVIATLVAAGVRVVAVYDDNPAARGGSLLGVPVRGPVDAAADARLPTVLGIGDNRHRATLAGRLDLEWATAVHPGAVVHPSVRVGAGTVIFAGVVVQPNAVLEEHVILNTSCSVDHDCVVGPFAHVSVGARLTGAVHVGRGSMLGAGCVLLPRAVVGEHCTVGAGAVVLGDIASGMTVIGVPARPIGTRGQERSG
jgi:sugar O-acyltransferase (sialic acid O-acetyltransferase NeuD family)